MKATNKHIYKEIERLKAEIMQESIVINDIVIKEQKNDTLEIELLDKEKHIIRRIKGVYYSVFVDMKLIYYGLI